MKPEDTRLKRAGFWLRKLQRELDQQGTWIRDVVFNEDHHQARTGNGPQIMASLRNLAINLIRLFHGPTTSITTHLRHHARHPNHATKLLVTTPQPRL